MSSFESIHSEEFFVQTSSMDPKQTVRMPAYLEMMQEAASGHSAIYSLTITDLLRQNKTWVITKQKIRITGYPVWREKIRLDTWILSPTRLVFPRAYIAYDSTGRIIFEAFTYWCVLDLERRRPLPIGSLGTFIGCEHPDFTLEPVIGKPNGPIEDADCHFEFTPQIQFRDTDVNSHVNNNAYTEWCLETMPVDVRMNNNPSFFEIHYQRETYINDTIHAVAEFNSRTGECSHIITAERGDTMVDVCRASSIWKSRDRFSH
jgi:acyl-ACP thioesterase